MKMLISVLASALIGIGVCLAIVLVANASGMTPRFPAIAGEDDFNLRFQYFLFAAIPGFALLGAWIGKVSASNWRIAGRMWAGALAGSIVTILIARFLSNEIGTIGSRATANGGVLAFFIALVLASTLGAWLAGAAQRR